jgi:hypothetical protein
MGTARNVTCEMHSPSITKKSIEIIEVVSVILQVIQRILEIQWGICCRNLAEVLVLHGIGRAEVWGVHIQAALGKLG